MDSLTLSVFGMTSATADGGLSGLSFITKRNTNTITVVMANCRTVSEIKSRKNWLGSSPVSPLNHAPVMPNDKPDPIGPATI